MIISHKYKFIFIKTLKTAGTSLEVYLSEHCGPEDVLTPVIPHEPKHAPRNYKGIFNPVPALRTSGRNKVPAPLTTLKHLAKRIRYYNHMSALVVRSRVPDGIWNSYLKFCVEREPHSKTMSLYRMMRANDGITDMQQIFSQGLLPTDWGRYSDLDGAVLMDRILKYENLDMELSTLFEELGVPFSGSLRVKAKAIGRPKDLQSETVGFTDEQEATLRSVFRREFETLYPDH